MSNMPMLPSGPSRQDVDSMRKFKEIMEGKTIHEGVKVGGQTSRVNNTSTQSPYMPYHNHQADVQNMKSILEKFYESQGNSIKENVRETVKPLYESQNISQRTPDSHYEVRTRLTENSKGKEIKTYDVVCERQIISEGHILKEAAKSISIFMNRGHDINSSRINEILDLESDYKRNRIEAGKIKKHYDRCVELGESEAAAIFSKKFHSAKANFVSAKESLESIYESLI